MEPRFSLTSIGRVIGDVEQDRQHRLWKNGRGKLHLPRHSLDGVDCVQQSFSEELMRDSAGEMLSLSMSLLSTELHEGIAAVVVVVELPQTPEDDLSSGRAARGRQTS